MNEHPEEFYVLQEQQAIRELVTASAARGCIVMVGGAECAHAEDVHVRRLPEGQHGRGEWVCTACIREGRPVSRFEGLSKRASGYDHSYIDHIGPSPASQDRPERAAA